MSHCELGSNAALGQVNDPSDLLVFSSVDTLTTPKPCYVFLDSSWGSRNCHFSVCCANEQSGELRSDPRTHQLLGPHVVEDPLSVLTVVPALHDGQEQLGSIVLRGGETMESLPGAKT